MKKIQTILILTLVLMMPSLASAQTENTLERADLSRQNIEERINRYKTQIEERISSAKQELVKNRCEAAQSKIQEFLSRANASSEDRQSRFQELSTRLNNLSLRLTEAGVDTTEFDLAVTQLNELIEEASDNKTGLLEVLNDLVQLDCQSDPEAFWGALLSARNELTQEPVSIGEIKEFLNETLKPLLQSIKINLQSVSGGENGQ